MKRPIAARSLPFLLLLPIVGCGAEPASPKPTARPVLVTEVESASRSESAYTGVVAARIESDLGFRVGGKIVERRVGPGDRVAAGDPLLVLDVEDFELALRAARNRVRAAEANLKQARDDEGRYRQLAEIGFESKRKFELATTALQVALAELSAVRSDARQIENQRGYATLVADGDGVLTEVNVERGQVVAIGQVVARLAHNGAREAVVSIPEAQLALASNTARAFAYGSSKTPIRATLRELSASADPVTRTFRARYVLDDDARPPIGSTITVRLANADPGGVTRVPIGALHDPGTGPGVWLIDEQGHVRFAPVRVVKLGQEDVTIDSDVTPGQRIVALGAHLLHEGDAVRTMRAPGEVEPVASELAQGE